MQVSCLQMQDAEMPESNKQLLSQIRNELNTSWIQLRELLTTFRLQLTEPGLRPALEASCHEFSARLGVPGEARLPAAAAVCSLPPGHTCTADRP
ncbi:nitrate/nitrite sensor protein narX [Enterobacter asburiae]|uniref:Nitrate/nitrite sensor protein narX n=1 Tax=Enterobacter asburiae TaxID=61645 RepID=A0A376FBX7_ENTAS|nr:nitrate/nitrite sensor protein narX [Enterobacter asburiae]